MNSFQPYPTSTISRRHLLGGMLLSALPGTLGFAQSENSILLRGGSIVEGGGAEPFTADVRISGDLIREVGRLSAKPDERVIDVSGLAIAPGFIDAHSHADSDFAQYPVAETHIRQGITTAVGGQDGASPIPLSEEIDHLTNLKTGLNFAFFAGHGSIRSQAIGMDDLRAAKPAEIERMCELLRAAVKAGALGLSSGLEYDPGHYATTDELIKLMRAVKEFGGMYISHMRDEGNGVLDSIRELIRIGHETKLPAQISHMKLATKPVWGKSRKALKLVDDANRAGDHITIDVYPYIFWQSSITAMTISRDWENLAMWRNALEENGGPDHVLLSKYTPNLGWEGKTISVLAKEHNKEPADMVRDIVRGTQPHEKGEENVIVTSMNEEDLQRILAHPKAMICSDGGLRGTHPRGAGAFPRVLGKYVREERLFSLPEAIRKMTWLPASAFGLTGRGRLKPNFYADLVVFDPSTVADTATTDFPTAHPRGIQHVMVNGKFALLNGEMTGERSGRFLRASHSI